MGATRGQSAGKRTPVQSAEVGQRSMVVGFEAGVQGG